MGAICAAPHVRFGPQITLDGCSSAGANLVAGRGVLAACDNDGELHVDNGNVTLRTVDDHGALSGSNDSGANVLVAPGADSGEIVLLTNGRFGWPIGSTELGNDIGALAVGGVHNARAAQDNISTLGGTNNKIGGNDDGLHAHIDSRAAPSDGAGSGDFFGEKVACDSFGPGAVNSVFPLDRIGMETPMCNGPAPLGGPGTYTGDQKGLADMALLCPTTPTTG
jgi:hypothetical protein